MKVLVIGGGAREHAIAWKLSQSPLVSKLYCAPGNAGIADIAECINIKSEDVAGLLSFALENKIDMTVVGPEGPLIVGIVDAFEEKGLKIFGPCKEAAKLEGSKVFAKNFMQKHNIPTAKYKTYDSFEKAIKELSQFELPLVIKADGLAAGKGVIIAQNKQEAVDSVSGIMEERHFGDAGSSIVIEEFLEGKEVSVLAFLDGDAVIPMVSAQDYKRALTGDRGLNTGGMGAVSPAFHYDKEAEKAVKREIIDRTVQALKAEGITYKGVLYFGIMLTKHGPKLLEYNVRFGDPETEVILTRLQSDLLEIINSAVEGKLASQTINWSDQNAVCVVAASGGYPEKYATGYEISGAVVKDQETIVFHAGTKIENNKLVTAGGRVLVVSALGENYNTARSKVYEKISKIKFKDEQYRTDIGKNS